MVEKIKANVTAFAFDTADIGYRNQLIGAITAIHQHIGVDYPVERCLLRPSDVNTVKDLPYSLCYTSFSNFKKFRAKIFSVLDAWFVQMSVIPRIFITVYNSTESSAPDNNVDMISRVVKEYYCQHHLGKILTVVLSSKLHNYKYVDFINVPKHLLSFPTRVRLLQNKKLRKKVLITVGIIHSFTKEKIAEKKTELVAMFFKDAFGPVATHLSKLQNVLYKNKKLVICLGGRVEGSEIVFNVNYAQSLFEKCVSLARHEYGIIIVNGPRTPNDVSDYLYERTKNHPDIVFHNCKNIAKKEEERAQWRLYSGKYEQDFVSLSQIGNIYPAVLGFENTMVVHTVDSFACCETLSVGIPTAISAKGIYINKSVRPDTINMFQLMIPKYALDFEEFVKLACYMELEPKNFKPTILSNPLKVFAKSVLSRIND